MVPSLQKDVGLVSPAKVLPYNHCLSTLSLWSCELVQENWTYLKLTFLYYSCIRLESIGATIFSKSSIKFVQPLFLALIVNKHNIFML